MRNLSSFQIISRRGAYSHTYAHVVTFIQQYVEKRDNMYYNTYWPCGTKDLSSWKREFIFICIGIKWAETNFNFVVMGKARLTRLTRETIEDGN